MIMLLDACHAGPATGGGSAFAADADRLRKLMRSPNVTLLTIADQLSVEDRQWRNGAFTEAVLEALTTRADEDGNGLISMVEMTRSLTGRVPEITGGKQTPGIDTRFESNVFVAGL